MSKIGGPIDPKIVDKIVERACEETSYVIRTLEAGANEAGGSLGDTPIERALFLAVWSGLKFGWTSLRDMRLVEDLRPRPQAPRNVVFCIAQLRPLDWPVDFAFYVSDRRDPKQTLIVECDGHDFHERTPEQAIRDRSRDRRLQEAGYTVYRFTGAEIWRDPCGCADSVIRWLGHQHLDVSDDV